MGTLRKLHLKDLGGSLHDGLPASSIGLNEWADLLNFYQYGTKLVTRPSANKVTSTAHGSLLTSMFAFKESAGNWTLIVGTPTTLGKLSAGAIAALTNLDGTSYGSSYVPWSFAQFRDYVLAARRGVGLLRASSSSFQTAGIARPLTAPILATGGTGDIIAANYYAVFTYYNTLTGAESDYSPASLVYAAPGSKAIDWSGITASANPQVNARRIYRTLLNQTDEYYFVDTILNNSATTYTGDNKLTNDLGAPASRRNGLPPASIELVVLWKERAFCSDGIDVLFSEYQRPESFYSSSRIPVYQQDGHRIRALHPWENRLFVGKTNGCHLITSADGFKFELSTLSHRRGCWSHHSVKLLGEGVLAWYAGDDFVISGGSEPRSIGDSKVRTILDSIPDSQKEFVVSAVVPSLGWYVAAVPTGSSSTNVKLLVYNYRTQVWSVFQYGANGTTSAPRFLAEFFDTNYGPLLYGSFEDGHVWNLLSTTSGDDGSAFTCRGRLKKMGHELGEEGSTHSVRVVQINCDSIAQNLTLNVYRDGSSSAYDTRTVSLAEASDWKRFKLSTEHAPAYLTQIGFEYSGLSELNINEILIESVDKGRRRRRAA